MASRKIDTLPPRPPEVATRQLPFGRRVRIKALEAFEAASRHLSIADAANELGVTAGAVRHHIRYLSEELGEQLFSRSGKLFTLTPAGKKFAARLQSAFAEIDRTIHETTGTKQDIIRLALCTSFGPGWLIKRLHKFYSTYRLIDLQLFLYAREPDIRSYTADAFITLIPDTPGFWSMPIQPEYLVAVHAKTDSNVRGQIPLISKSSARFFGKDDWAIFAQETGENLIELDVLPRITVSHFLLAYEMAKEGIGIALVPDFLVKDEDEQSAIVRLNNKRVSSGKTYFFCVKEARKNEPAIKSFIDWLKNESSICLDV